MTLCITNKLKEALGGRLHNVESPSLRLSKYVTLDKNDKESKRNEIDAVVACHNKHAIKPAKFSPTNAVQLYMKLCGRLIVNQAGGVLENAGLCLHRNFGYPYIPGSAVKGVTRHYAWEQWSEMTDGAERLQLAKKIAFTFGFPTNGKSLDHYLELNFPELFKDDQAKYKSCSGSVAFLDAIPEEKPKLVTDILTNHHPEYYKGNLPVALDSEDPNPQPFPVVETGSTFIFQLAPLKADADSEFAKDMLKNALEINGVGAKTSAGYGWFEKNIQAAKNAEIASLIPNEAIMQKYAKMSDEEFTPFVRSYRGDIAKWKGTREEQRSLLEYCLGDGAVRVATRKSKQAVNKLATHFKI